MGGGSSIQAKASLRSRELDTKLQQSLSEESDIKKLLLLGTGESGKSTILKQMVTLYGSGFDQGKRMAYEKVIYSNILEAIISMINFSELTEDASYKIEDRSLVDYFLNMDTNTSINTEIALKVEKIWGEPGMKKCYEDRVKFQIPDSINYFFDKVKIVGETDYCPSYDDVLRVRARTTGILETSFELKGLRFKLLDVGGQRNERRKWIHCFEGVTVVMFIVSLSEYNQVLFEDDTQNRFEESLKLFEETVHSPWFSDSSFVLFLNKRDLFKTKIETIPITASPICADYDGDPKSYDESVEYIQKLFESHLPEDKQAFTHVTCAMDKDNIYHVFEAIKDTVLRKSLQQGGLV